MGRHHVNYLLDSLIARRGGDAALAHRKRAFALSAISMALVAHGSIADAKIRVRSPVSADVVAVSGESGFTARVVVRDDQGLPADHLLVKTELLRADGSSAALRRVAPCRSPRAAGTFVVAHAPEGEVSVLTDASGKACFAAELKDAVVSARVVVQGGDSFIGTTVTVPVRAREPREIAFERADAPIYVDEENVISVNEQRADGHAIGDGEGRPLVLEVIPRVQPKDDRLTRATAAVAANTEIVARGVEDEAGHAAFTVKAGALGEPGTVRLRARPDSAESEASAGSTAEFRTLEHVVLSLAEAPVFETADSVGGEVQGVVRVAVRSKLGAPISSGTVVAEDRGQSLGAALVAGGEARVPVRMVLGSDGAPTVTARYEPAAPWFVADAPVVVDVVPKGLSRGLAWPLFGLFCVALALVGRLAQTRVAERQKRGAVTMGPPSAKIDRVDEPPADATWRGEVRDAHDGNPLSGVQVMVVQGGFTKMETVAQTTTASDGTFLMASFVLAPGMRMVLSRPSHETLSRNAPPPGTLRIALVSRRRGLLTRFVSWAKTRPVGDDLRGTEPTPLQVVREVGTESAEGRWAAEVHVAAFGPDPVGEEIAVKIDGLAPKTKPPRVRR